MSEVNQTSYQSIGNKMAFKKKLKLHLKKGALHKDLGVKEGEKIPEKKLEVKDNDSTLEIKRKVFAQNAKKWHHA